MNAGISRLARPRQPGRTRHDSTRAGSRDCQPSSRESITRRRAIRSMPGERLAPALATGAGIVRQQGQQGEGDQHGERQHDQDSRRDAGDESIDDGLRAHAALLTDPRHRRPELAIESFYASTLFCQCVVTISSRNSSASMDTASPATRRMIESSGRAACRHGSEELRPDFRLFGYPSGIAARAERRRARPARADQPAPSDCEPARRLPRARRRRLWVACRLNEDAP
jgi:hypothetical protein